MLHRWPTISILAAALCGCSTSAQAPKPSVRIITEREARLVGIARTAAAAEGFSLDNAIYQVRRDDDGWVIQVDEAPGYSGTGNPSVILDSTFLVRLAPDEHVTEIRSHSRWIKFIIIRPEDLPEPRMPLTPSPDTLTASRDPAPALRP